MEAKGDVVAEHEGSAAYDAGAPGLDLFVVHAAADVDFVRGYLIPALNLPGPRVLRIDELTPGAMVVSEIERGVSSRFTVVVLSAACLEDRWAVFGAQLASYLSINGVRVIPLRLEDCKPPLGLTARVALDLTDRSRWEVEVARLRELLQSVAPAAEPIPCPYPGMRPFAANEASRFFGRDKELDDLIGRIDGGEREIYVIGPSGSGKSSLVQAGLLHALEAGTSRLGRSFVVRTLRPGERPADRLADALDGSLATPAVTIGAFVARHSPAERVLVFVDQLEELFTHAETAEQQRFVATLRALRAETRCYMVLALRADFFGAFMESELWSDLTGRISRVEVAPLRGPTLRRAIMEPASLVGVHVEARLCDRLVSDAAAEPGVLPLVQVTLRLLWDKRRQRLLGFSEYEALGDGGSGLHVAIAKHADAAMRRLTTAQQTIARRMLLRLVSFGEGRPDTRRQQLVQALRSSEDDDTEFSSVLRQLVKDRLVTTDGAEATDDAFIDLSHEAIITAWPALRAWIAHARADEQRRRRLEAKVSEWIERGRGAASLLDTVELSEAVQWMQSDPARELGYGAELLSFVEASRGEIERVQRHTQEARRIVGMTYLEQGRALLLDGYPMQALPYFVVARTEGVESPALRMLFAQASSNPPLVTFVGHGLSVVSAAFSPDATRVVTASLDGTARLWDATTGKPLTPPLEHRGIVCAVAFSADGTRVATASADKTARVWDATTGAPVTAPLEHRDGVCAVAFSPDGTRVVTASSDTTARVWDASAGTPVSTPLEHQDRVVVARFSPDGTRVVTASWDQTARVWDATTMKQVSAPLEHSRAVAAAIFSPDGTRVVTASYDKTARVWDAMTGRPVTAPLRHLDVVIAAAFSPDGTRVVTGSGDNTARVWDAATGKPVTAPIEHQGLVAAAAFSPNGTRVITASYDRTARVWDAITGMPVTAQLEHRRVVTTAAFSNDGIRVVTASDDKTARVWDATTGTSVTASLEHRDAVCLAAFSPDGNHVVTASDDKTARVWNARTGTPMTAPLKHRDAVTAAVFSPDGALVATASEDKTARVWDATTGKPVTAPLEHHDAVTAVAFSPDGVRVVTASYDKTARVWDALTGAPVTAPLEHQDYVIAAAFSPDGTRVVTASEDKTARVWDITTGEAVTAPLEHEGGVNAAAFSPDGTRVVTASEDKTARVWDTTTGEAVTAPLEHEGGVNAAAFSLDGIRVVTASRDKTARVWSATTGKPVTIPFEHQGSVAAAAFSPDGTRVVTASWDQTAQVWDAATGKAVTVPLKHQDRVKTAVFSPDGAHVVTASYDKTARVWSLSIDDGSLEDWCLLARCSPFELVDGVLMSNHDPLTVSPRR